MSGDEDRKGAAPGPVASDAKAHALAPRLVRLADVPASGLTLTIEADPAERCAIAARDGLVSLESLRAELHVSRDGDTRAQARGLIQASMTRTCVVSLDPFETDLEAAVEADFAVPPSSRAGSAQNGRVETVSFADPGVDPIIDGKIDLGALVEEFFVLNLDPYPRKPGASFAADDVADAGEAGPFAVLRCLKKE